MAKVCHVLGPKKDDQYDDIIKSQFLHWSKEVAILHMNVCLSLVSIFYKDQDQVTWGRKGLFHLIVHSLY